MPSWKKLWGVVLLNFFSTHNPSNSQWLCVTKWPGSRAVSVGLNTQYQKCLQNFHQKFLQTSLQKQMFPFRNVKRFQKLIWLFSGKILQAWAYFNSHNIARLSTLRNCTLLIRLPGTVSNGLNAQQLKIFTKVPLKGSLKLLESEFGREMSSYTKINLDNFSEPEYTEIYMAWL